jgi:outer membrane protein OmpA-like peptidoglycan-associated protein
MKRLIALPILIALGACTTDQAGGHLLRDGGLGHATAHNIAIQNGDKKFVVEMADRFANEIDNTVNFAFNSSALDAQARATLKKQADWIKQFPEVRFRVYGHTDAVGSDAYNQRLGKRRANAVVNFFASQGISRNRLEALVSLGETDPVVATQERERQNRRTVTEVSGFVYGHPTLLDGQYAAVIYREYIASAVPATEVEVVLE